MELVTQILMIKKQSFLSKDLWMVYMVAMAVVQGPVKVIG
jgi:hypothetical protein